jgi:hypothetical protein
MLTHRPTHRALQRRQDRLDPSPHLVAKHFCASHRRSIAPQSRLTSETRPSNQARKSGRQQRLLCAGPSTLTTAALRAGRFTQGEPNVPVRRIALWAAIAAADVVVDRDWKSGR